LSSFELRLSELCAACPPNPQSGTPRPGYIELLVLGATRSGVDSAFKPAIIGTMTGPDDDKYLLANHEAARL